MREGKITRRQSQSLGRPAPDTRSGRIYQPTADELKEMACLPKKRSHLIRPAAKPAACSAGSWHQAHRGIIPWKRLAADRMMKFAQRAAAAEDTDECLHWILPLPPTKARSFRKNRLRRLLPYPPTVRDPEKDSAPRNWSRLVRDTHHMPHRAKRDRQRSRLDRDRHRPDHQNINVAVR